MLFYIVTEESFTQELNRLVAAVVSYVSDKVRFAKFKTNLKLTKFIKS